MQLDTRILLRSGIGIFVTGIVAALLTMSIFGGISHQGPHTDAGWLALVLALGCLPTGFITLALALAKVIGDRRR